MRLYHVLTALVVVFALTVTAQAADAAKKAQKAKKAGAIAGVVSDIQKEAGKENAGSITVKTVLKKKDAAAAAGEEKKFTVTEATKFEKAPVKQKGVKLAKDQPGTPATFADVKQGDRVGIVAKGDSAEKVIIMGPGKKGK